MGDEDGGRRDERRECLFIAMCVFRDYTCCRNDSVRFGSKFAICRYVEVGATSLWNLGVAGDIGAMDVAIGKPRSYSIRADGLRSEQSHKGHHQIGRHGFDEDKQMRFSYEVSYMPTARLSHIETHSIIISLGKYVPYQCKVCPCQQQPAP